MRGGGAVRGGGVVRGGGGGCACACGRACACACVRACDMERGGPAACCSLARLPLSRPPPLSTPRPASASLSFSLSLSLSFSPHPTPRLTDTASPPLSRRPIPRSPPLPSAPSQTPFPGMFLRDPATRYWRVCQLGAAAATGPWPLQADRAPGTGN